MMTFSFCKNFFNNRETYLNITLRPNLEFSSFSVLFLFVWNFKEERQILQDLILFCPNRHRSYVLKRKIHDPQPTNDIVTTQPNNNLT